VFFANEPEVTDDDRGDDVRRTRAVPIVHVAARRRPLTIVVSVLVVALSAAAAVWFLGARHALQQQNLVAGTEISKAAFDWVELLITIPDDPLTGNAQMEEMKRHTADPLNSRFEDTMGPYFQDYAPWSEQPLEITSVSMLEAGATTDANHTAPSGTTLLVTTTARDQVDRGHGFWVEIIDRDGQYLVADFGAVE
jgi:hypothetical protein